MHFSVFIPIHRSFGFFDIFLEGGLETPKTPLGPAPVYIDQYLTWQNHIDYVLRRVRGKVYSINRLNPPPTVKKLLYQVYILPILDYCDVVWAPTNAKQNRRL